MNDSTLSRLGEFRQLKKEIRGSDRHLIVGVDVAKEKHHAFFGAATGRSLLRRLIFENNREGFETLLHRAQAIMTREGLEPTGSFKSYRFHKVPLLWKRLG